MRLRLAMRTSVPTRFRFPVLEWRFLPLLLAYLVAIQPFGSIACIFFGACVILLGALLRPLPALPLANWGALALAMGAYSLLLSPLVGQNAPLLILYASYFTLLILGWLVMRGAIDGLTAAETRSLVQWLLLADLAFNLPSVALELARHGPGDWVTGLSGLFLNSSLSQNRTNAVRGCFIAVLAAYQWRAGRSRLAAVSLGFNLAMVVLATSMTTLLSGIAAFAACGFLRGKLRQKLTVLFGCSALAAGGDYMNQVRYGSSSIFTFILNFNSRWIPKLDAFVQYARELIFEYPWLLFTGNGLGNFLNRFALLTNYRNYSGFPFKEAISPWFSQELIREHFIERYHLEQGIVGNSIISTPWSGVLSLLLEWGLLGILAALVLSRRFWLGLLGVKGSSLLGSGRFLLLLLVFNMFFDCYQDYVEIMLPFFLVALLLIKLDRAAMVEAGARPV